MPRIVQGTVVLPDGSNPAGTTIEVELVANAYIRSAGYDGGGQAILGRTTTRVSDAGVWSVLLADNDTLTPADTYYLATTRVPGWPPVTQTFYVPYGSSQLSVADILIDPDLEDTVLLGHGALTGLMASDAHPHYGHFPEALRGFRLALARARTSGDVVRVAVIGDSLTQGTAAALNNGWVRRVESYLARAVGGLPTMSTLLDAAEAGWVPAHSTGTTPGFDNVDGNPDFRYGLGGLSQVLAAATSDEMDNTVVCDKVEVYYSKQETGGADLEVYIDDVLQTTIGTTDGGVDGVSCGHKWTSDVLDFEAHELKLVASGTGTAIVNGAYFYRGGTRSGVAVDNGGHSGWKVAHFTGSEVLDDDGELHDGGTHSGTIDHLTQNPPDLVLIALGVNDYVSGGATAWKSTITALVDLVQAAAANASIALVFPHKTLQARTDWSTDYRQAMLEVAQAESLAFIDVDAWIGPSNSVEDVYGIADLDNTHLNDVGHEAQAHAVVSALLAGVPRPWQEITALVKPISATTRTITVIDVGAFLRFTSSSAVTVTVPADATSFATPGVEVRLRATDGTVTVTAGAGATVNGAGDVTAGQEAVLRHVGNDTWDMVTLG